MAAHASHPHSSPMHNMNDGQGRGFSVITDNYDIAKATRPASLTTSSSTSSPHPRPLNESQTLAHLDLTENYDPSKVHILVVDDDVLTRKILQSLLRKFCFNVTVVGSGTEAWEKLHEKGVTFDLVLTDVMMPSISGFNLLQMINKDSTLRQIPVILMSGTAIDTKTANDSIKIGGQDYLTKPIGKELLKKKLDMVLQNVYQKRKEQEYRSVLAQERHKGSLLAKQMAAKEHEIDELKKKMNEMSQFSREVLESPLQSITRSIENVVNDADWSQHEVEIRTQLGRILKELAGSSNLYRPSLENLMQNDRVAAVTKSFLVSELAEPTSSPTSFPTPPNIPTNMNGIRRNSVNTFPSSIKHTDDDHKTWEFDPFKYSESELWPIIVDMFANFQLIELYHINIKKLQRFIMTVNTLYHKENRYHNFVHAFDVTHACYSFLTIMNAQQYLTHLDIFALLVGSLCHDLDHPGFNNVFQVNAQTELAVYYNDISVLESHHASMTFRVLRNPDCNIFENLTEEQHKEIRRSMISLVLATDMSNHFEYVSKFQHHLSTHAFDRNKKEDRQMILNFLLKCADLSNVAKPRLLNDEWSNRVSDEFFMQADYERAHKYPVAPHMDRTKTTRPRIAADFMDFVATPMFRILAEFLPASSMLMDYINLNRQAWQKGLDALNKEKEEAEQASSGKENGDGKEEKGETTITTTTSTTSSPATTPSSTPSTTPSTTPTPEREKEEKSKEEEDQKKLDATTKKHNKEQT